MPLSRLLKKEPTRNNYTDGDPDSYPKAEKLLDYEAGYTFANQWLTAGANFYYMDYTDQLVLTGALNDIGEALTEKRAGQLSHGNRNHAGNQTVQMVSMGYQRYMEQKPYSGFRREPAGLPL